MRTIRVTGRGNLTLQPDLTRISLFLSALCEEYGDAVARSASDTEKLKEVLAPLGFAREDLKTSQFSVDPEYEGYQEEGAFRQRLTGYRYHHTLKIEFPREDRLLGQVLYAVAHSELQPEFDITYTVRDKESARGALLAGAVADAGAKAALLAQAAGVTLKEVRRIDCSFGETDMTVRPMMNRMASADCMAAGIPLEVQPEDIVLSDTVTVVWEIG